MLAECLYVSFYWSYSHNTLNIEFIIHKIKVFNDTLLANSKYYLPIWFNYNKNS